MRNLQYSLHHEMDKCWCACYRNYQWLSFPKQNTHWTLSAVPTKNNAVSAINAAGGPPQVARNVFSRSHSLLSNSKSNLGSLDLHYHITRVIYPGSIIKGSELNSRWLSITQNSVCWFYYWSYHFRWRSILSSVFHIRFHISTFQLVVCVRKTFFKNMK